MIPVGMKIHTGFPGCRPVWTKRIVIRIVPIVKDLMDNFGNQRLSRIRLDLVGSCDLGLRDANAGMRLCETEQLGKGDDAGDGVDHCSDGQQDESG